MRLWRVGATWIGVAYQKSRSSGPHIRFNQIGFAKSWDPRVLAGQFHEIQPAQPLKRFGRLGFYEYPLLARIEVIALLRGVEYRKVPVSLAQDSKIPVVQKVPAGLFGAVVLPRIKVGMLTFGWLYQPFVLTWEKLGFPGGPYLETTPQAVGLPQKQKRVFGQVQVHEQSGAPVDVLLGGPFTKLDGHDHSDESTMRKPTVYKVRGQLGLLAKGWVAHHDYPVSWLGVRQWLRKVVMFHDPLMLGVDVPRPGIPFPR